MNLLTTPGQVEVTIRLYSDAVRFRCNQGLWPTPGDPSVEFHKYLRSRMYSYHPERQDWTLLLKIAATQKSFAMAAEEIEALLSKSVALRFEWDRDLSFERDPTNARPDEAKALASVATA